MLYPLDSCRILQITFIVVIFLLLMANLINVNNDLDQITEGKAFVCTPEECLNYIDTSERNINLLHINIRSVNKNFPHLQVLLHRLNVDTDIIVLTECWLSKINNIPVLDGYESHFTNTNCNQNDGIIIYTKSSLQTTVSEPDFAGGNCLVCHLDKKISVVAIYRSPSLNSRENFDKFSTSLINVYDNIKSICPTIALVGDLNIDIKQNNMNERSLDYLTLNASHGLMPTHLFPTRDENCLDHIFLKSCLTATTLVLEAHVTDHKPLLLSLKNGNPSHKLCTTTTLNHKAIVEELETVDFAVIYKIENINEAMNKFITIIKSIVLNHSKQVKIPRKKKIIKPWITPGLLKCMKHRDRMHIKSKKSPDNIILKSTYSRYRNFCNNLLRKLKKSYETAQLEKAKNNPKVLWKTIKEITNTHKAKPSPVELLTIRDSPKSAINEVGHFFANIGKNLASKIINDTASSPAGSHPSPSPTGTRISPVNSLVILEVDEADVESLILQLRSDCAVGWDGISSLILKNSRHVLVPPITYLFNRCLQEGVFPEAFKKAVVHPIYKGGNRDCVNNYRPISVLPALSKVLEKILNNSLRKFLDKHQLIANNQYGFRTSLSTDDAVLDFTQQVASNLDNKSKCLGIFLDLSKAFDTVSVPKLIMKLESVGVRGIPLEIFKDYLKNRKQSIKIDNHLSDEFLVSYGVPQGGILSPTLFQIYLNDLCRLNLPNGRIYAYADDTAILVDGSSWDIVKANAEVAMTKVMIWLNSNLLTLNLQKTTYVPFAIRCNAKPSPSFTITPHSCTNSSTPCTCSPLARSESVKYLGVHIDGGLRWDKQIDAVATRTLRLIQIFKSLRASADLKTLKMVYLALCQSVIGYCIVTWGGAAKTKFLRVERAQRAVLKVMMKKPYRYPTTELFSDCQVLTVRQLYVLKSTLRKHAGLPPHIANKRSYVPPNIQHKTSFAQHQYYILSTHIYKKINKHLNIINLNSHPLKSKVTEWLLLKDYAYTESLLTYVV